MKLMEEFLCEFNKLLAKNNEIKEYERAQGNSFNIFNVLGMTSNEVKLHSALIVELLDPKGSHGMKDLFLKAFIETLDISDFNLKTKNASVEKEKYVGRKTQTEGGRLDIMITDTQKVIIIENKIYAHDQGNQLLRYKNSAKDFEDYKLYYLTLHCDNAKDTSLGLYSSMCHEDYECISYEKHIFEWIDKCIKISSEKPLVNNTLVAYRNLIKQLTYQNDSYHDKMTSLMTEKKYALAVVKILELEDDWFLSLLKRYVFNELQKFANENNLKFEYTTDKGFDVLWFYKKEWIHYCIKVATDKNRIWGPMYYGISWYNKPKTRIKKSQKALDCLTDSPIRDWPYGTSWFYERFKIWNNSLVESIINGELTNYIKSCISEVLSEIEEKNINLY